MLFIIPEVRGSGVIASICKSWSLKIAVNQKRTSEIELPKTEFWSMGRNILEFKTDLAVNENSSASSTWRNVDTHLQ